MCIWDIFTPWIQSEQPTFHGVSTHVYLGHFQSVIRNYLFWGEQGIFSENHVNIILIYIDFIVNRNRTDILSGADLGFSKGKTWRCWFIRSWKYYFLYLGSRFEQQFRRISEVRLLFRLSLQKAIYVYSVYIDTYMYAQNGERARRPLNEALDT